ncbi:MAG TPA: hypothetical protein VMM78_20090 [Thermomicrobiales bacterium]|nr:hypothetical protein [Thermomicrobiales bacterium]
MPGGDVTRVIVAALLLRPDGRTTHLHVAGSFAWPNQMAEALAAVESLIQAHADQWFPARALWREPGELLLSGEVR